MGPEAGGGTALVKVTLVSNDGVLHTEMRLVLLQPNCIETCQKQSSHFSLAVYLGKDDTHLMCANQGLQQDG